MSKQVEAVRNLEQQESGEILRLRCVECARSFSSVEQLASHQSVCRLPARDPGAVIKS